jgi:PilZ domain
MSDQDKRRSERVVPFVSDEEVIVIHRDGGKNVMAKMMDLSESGTLTYLLEEADLSGSANLSVYHQGKVFQVPATVVRRTGRLIAFEFANPSLEAIREIQSKLIRMEVEWMRLSRRA